MCVKHKKPHGGNIKLLFRDEMAFLCPPANFLGFRSKYKNNDLVCTWRVRLPAQGEV